MNNNLSSKRRGGAAPMLAGGLVLVALLVFLAANSLFVVREWEQVVITQFGEIRGEPIREAGLHFKRPFIQEVHRFEKRLVRWDGAPFTLYTRDRRTIQVNVTARWRIENASVFLTRLRTVDRANEHLSRMIEGAVRAEIGNHDLFEVVRSSNRILRESIELTIEGDDSDLDLELEDMATLGREIRELRRDQQENYLVGRPVVNAGILEQARDRINEAGLGIHLEDILVKQLNYTRDIESNVYAQMNAELQKISAGFRSHGRKNAERRLGEMERELARIESAAQEESRRIRGRAEAAAIEIFAEAYNRDPELYRFLRTLEAYGNALAGNASLIISTESALFELLKRPVFTTPRIQQEGENAGMNQP